MHVGLIHRLYREPYWARGLPAYLQVVLQCETAGMKAVMQAQVIRLMDDLLHVKSLITPGASNGLPVGLRACSQEFGVRRRRLRVEWAKVRFNRLSHCGS